MELNYCKSPTCTLTFLTSFLLSTVPLSCPSLLYNHVTILRGVPLHLSEVDVSGLNDVSQTSPRLKHLVEISQQCDKDIPVLWVVEDVAVDDLCTIVDSGVFG